MAHTATTSIQPFLDDLRHHVQTHYGERLAGLVLYGSQARGDATPESDLDILIVLHGAALPEDTAFANQINGDLLLRYGMLPSLLHTTLQRYQHEQSPLMINVRREGVVLTDGGGALRLDTALSQTPERTPGMTPEQTALLQKAEDSLRAARLMVQDNLYDFAASRAYYTMFYLAQALLLSKGLSFSKHAGVIGGFGQHIAHAGLVPQELHRYLREAQQARLIGDYAPEATLNKPDADTLIAHAEEFLAVAQQVLDSA